MNEADEQQGVPTEPGGIPPDLGGIPPGDWRSPYPSLDDVARASRVHGSPSYPVVGVDLNETEQLRLLELLQPFQTDVAFPPTREPDWRYYYENTFFPLGDAVALYSMLRHLEPQKLVEVGSGFSSAVILDTNERHLGNAIACTLIDPYFERLKMLLRPGDLDHVQVMSIPVQDVPMTVFESLGPNDVLFIDSSHVSKMGSDVNHIFFEVLPRLASGVHIHFHDVFYPFEYKAEWHRMGFAHTEPYLLRSFLQYNRHFEICLFNHYLGIFHRESVRRMVPLLPGGEVSGSGAPWAN
jgi:hypothetical protein